MSVAALRRKIKVGTRLKCLEHTKVPGEVSCTITVTKVGVVGYYVDMPLVAMQGAPMVSGWVYFPMPKALSWVDKDTFRVRLGKQDYATYRFLPAGSTTTPPWMALGAYLYTARIKLQLSLRALAKKLQQPGGEHYSYKYVHDIEQGNRHPSSDHLLDQLAAALQLDSDYLHYLAGVFPQADREQQLSPETFHHKMQAFRACQES